MLHTHSAAFAMRHFRVFATCKSSSPWCSSSMREVGSARRVLPLLGLAEGAALRALAPPSLSLAKLKRS
jgi:hypothetical protein